MVVRFSDPLQCSFSPESNQTRPKNRQPSRCQYRRPSHQLFVPERELGAVALASRAQATSRNVGLPRRRRSKERRSPMSHAGSKSRIFPHRCFNKMEMDTLWESQWPFLSAFDEQLPQRSTGTDDGQDWGVGEQVKYVVKVQKTLPFQPASFDLFDCEDVGGMRPQPLVDVAGPLAGFRDTRRGTWSTTCQWFRPSSFWYRRCNMRFVLQAAARRARGRASDLHAQDPSPTTIVSTSDCCGAADGGRAERRAAESTWWMSQGGEQHDFAGMWTGFRRGFVNSSSTRQFHRDEPLHGVSTCISWFQHGVDAIGDLGALIW